MYVIDLLKKINPVNVVEILTSFPDFFDMIDWNNTISDEEKEKIKQTIKQKYINEINRIKNLKNIRTDDTKVVFVSPRIENDGWMSASLIDLSEKEKILNSISNEEHFCNPLYSLTFTKRNLILGFKLSNINIERMGEETAAAVLLHEMTCFGIDEEARNIRQNEIISELKETTKRIETGEEKCIPIEDLWKELGVEDTRTPEEKEEESKKRHEEMLKNIHNYVYELKYVLKELNII